MPWPRAGETACPGPRRIPKRRERHDAAIAQPSFAPVSTCGEKRFKKVSSPPGMRCRGGVSPKAVMPISVSAVVPSSLALDLAGNSDNDGHDVCFFSRSRMTVLLCALLPAARPATDRAEVVRQPLRLHSRGACGPVLVFSTFSGNGITFLGKENKFRQRYRSACFCKNRG